MAFDPIKLESENLTERILSRNLSQFKDSPVFTAVLTAFAQEIQVFLDAAIGVISGRGCYEAETYALNIIGKLVGQKRTLVDYDTYDWFTFDDPASRFDESPWWVYTAPLTGTYQAGNEDFRQLIEGKILKNHTRYGSVPEIQDFILAAFGIPSDIELVDVMTVDIWVPWYTDDNTINLIGSYSTNGEDSDRNYFIPLPAGYQISNVYRYEEPVYFDGSSVLFDGSSVIW